MTCFRRDLRSLAGTAHSPNAKLRSKLATDGPKTLNGLSIDSSPTDNWPSDPAWHAGYAKHESKIERLAHVAITSISHMPTDYVELDRVLGGGLVPDSATLIGVERIVSIGREKHFPVMVIDSIQTIYSDQLQAALGSVSQVRESAAQLVRFGTVNELGVFEVPEGIAVAL